MSRIDQAWRRASGSLNQNPEPELPAERGEQTEDAALQRYARETAARAPIEPPVPPPHRTIVAPRLPRPRQFGRPQVTFDRKLVVNEKAEPRAVQQYRRLAGALEEVQGQRRLKALMITSASACDGKTLTSANLALTFSETRGKRVLLIDGDVRQPSIHTLFRLPNTTGLSHVLRSDHGDVSFSQVTANLSVLTAGQPDLNTMSALTSDRMQDLVEQFASQFDWVLIDAAPVGFMVDSSLLARITGAVVFVIGAESTPYPLVQRALYALGPEFVVGTVLNRVADDCIQGM
jgi:capsular exopolysaccharide synthesis family protein